ncbi:Linear gramicidin dehydrogenase LgrE [Methyloligella halotolerans]|uniref:Linear gramicidin dehydrogenase LgrE n=2 Tax=Methyloligella halotolerans TaxID=1177755 RepID=A0A1E2RYS1_9HYPH|nr:Linear gramicidin dehydrogenase LgrE [Methyloligella halotolerans]
MQRDGNSEAYDGAGFVPLGVNPGGTCRLVCFHYAGGSAQTFFPWTKLLPEDYALLAAELPGRGRRRDAPFVPSIRSAAQQLAEAWGPYGDLPAIFYGHSLGALLAYETARALKSRGQTLPELLVVSSRAAPGSPTSTHTLPALSDGDLRRYLESLEGTPRAVLDSKPLMKRAIPMLRADLQLIYDYRHEPGPALDIPIHVIGAIDDPFAPLECLLEWRSVAPAGFRLQMQGKGHFSPMRTPNAVMQAVEDHGLAPVREPIRAAS